MAGNASFFNDTIFFSAFGSCPAAAVGSMLGDVWFSCLFHRTMHDCYLTLTDLQGYTKVSIK
jgi:hypothetical protein